MREIIHFLDNIIKEEKAPPCSQQQQKYALPDTLL